MIFQKAPQQGFLWWLLSSPAMGYGFGGGRSWRQQLCWPHPVARTCCRPCQRWPWSPDWCHFARLLLCKVVLSFFFTLTFWEGDHCMACFKELKSYAHLLRVDFKRLNSRNNCSLGLDIPHTLLSSKINVIFTAKNKAPHFINQIKLVLMSDYLFSIQHKICGDVLNENQHSCGLKSSTAFVRDFLKEGT